MGFAAAVSDDASPGFRQTGGMFGFVPILNDPAIEHFSLKFDRDADNNFAEEDPVLSDSFAIDTSGYGPDVQPVHDAAGNLTFDGRYAYKYDAWNRLVTVRTAYRDASYASSTWTTSASVTEGPVIATYAYDGLGRRIRKDIRTGGDVAGALSDIDATYHFYYDGHRSIETRDGSDRVVKHHVWGLRYIDELVQVGINSDPVADATVDTFYYALTDANFNVTALVDFSGNLKERYEYTPYGQRKVFVSAGSNDPGCHAPFGYSQRWVVGTTAQTWGLCDVGHQGLEYDLEDAILHNRSRSLNTSTTQYLQRDFLNYVDGGHMRVYGGNNPVRYADPMGTVVISIHGVRSNGDWTNELASGMQQAWAYAGSSQQDVIRFIWGYEAGGKPWATTEASDSVEGMGPRSREARQRLRNLRDELRQLFDEFGCFDEPIQVIAHSQGTIITLGALKDGMQIDNFVSLGSPLDAEHGLRDLVRAAPNVSGRLYNYWSNNDITAGFKGGGTPWVDAYLGNGKKRYTLPANVRQIDVSAHVSGHTKFQRKDLALRFYASDLTTNAACCDRDNPTFEDRYKEIIERLSTQVH